MALDQRIHKDYFAGVLQLQALISDLTLTSTSFAPLSAGFSANVYMPLVLHNPSTGAYEIVYIVAHSAASTTVTVQRGKEGTTAQAWPANTQILDAVTARDLIPHFTRALLPTDAHLGMRALVTDENAVQAKYYHGWGPAVGMALARAIGPQRAGGNPPDSAILMASVGARTDFAPNGSGQVTITWRQPFPTACLYAHAWSIDATRFIGWCTPISENATDGLFYLHTVSGGNIVAAVGSPLSLAWIAYGY